MAGITVSVVDKVSPALARAVARIGDCRKPLSLAGMAVQRSFTRQFAASGTPPWKPLAKSTVRGRRKKSSRPLQDTGRLRRSYTSRAGLGSIWALSPLELRVGSNLEYAAIHQAGGTISHTVKAGRRSMRKTKSGQYRFMKAGSKRKASMSVFWSGGKQYSTTIPARPLNVLGPDRETVRKIFESHVKESFK